MKKIRFFMLPLFVASMCMALTSCGGGDDDGPVPPTPANNGGSSGSGDSGYDSGITPTGTQAIDLGLPSGILWANMNVGATTEEGYGQYFAWGETTGYGSDTNDGHFFNWYRYKWGTDTSLKKYCSSTQNGTVDNKTVLELSDDAARAIWGGDWRMPTSEEFKELLDNTTQERTTVNGINGIRLTSKINGNSVFLPASGYRKDYEIKLYESGAYYWTSSIYMYKDYGTSTFKPFDTYASAYGFNATGNIYGPTENSRYYGLGIRAVIDKANIQPSPEEGPEPTYPDIQSTPLTLEAIAGGSFTFRNRASGSVTYRIGGGAIQTIPANSTKTINVTAGQKVRFFGDNAAYATSDEYSTRESKNSHISGDVDFYVYGNIMSLVNGKNYATATTLTVPYTFARLFEENIHLKNHPSNSLLLPATTLSKRCYTSMFHNCTNLTSSPSLPATTLSEYCYAMMFDGCLGLTAASELPATTLTTRCYYLMFRGCKNLTAAPALPATSLEYGCYHGMFINCTSLASAPALPATTLGQYCYESMFEGCSNLTTPPQLPATIMKLYCYLGMFNGCTKLTSAPTLPATTLGKGCYSGMFNGCTNLTSAPALPATTLAESCYSGMFKGCTNLASAPALPATTLTDYCYKSMFEGCTSLAAAPNLLATTLKKDCYRYMFWECENLTYIKCFAKYNISENCYGWLLSVSSTGTFVKASGSSWPSGEGGIPIKWTVLEE